MILGDFRFACVAPICGLAHSSEAVMGLRASHDSGCVLCGLRAGRDSDGAPHDLWAGLLSGGASCGVQPPCAFNGVSATRKLSACRFFRIALCRFLADSFSISFQNAG